MADKAKSGLPAGFASTVKVRLGGHTVTLRRPPGKRTLTAAQIDELVLAGSHS